MTTTANLKNLPLNEMQFVETRVGTISVIRSYNGIEAFLSADWMPYDERGVKAHTAQDAIDIMIARAERYAPKVEAVAPVKAQSGIIAGWFTPAESVEVSAPVENLMETAFRQVLANKMTLDVATGGKWFKALCKAITVIENNNSIKFDGKVLTFFSRDSMKIRRVTVSGCHSSCECKGAISYHIGLFEILAYHAQLTGANVVQFPAVEANQVYKLAA